GREMRRHVGGGDGGDEGKLRPIGEFSFGRNQQGGEEIAVAAFPNAAAPAPSRALMVCSDPERPGFARRSAAQRLRVGGIQFGEFGNAEIQGSKAFAAASAMVMSGEAAKIKSSAKAPDSTMISCDPVPISM